MIAYHGTTIQRARRICREGLRPLPPSRRVWFAEDRTYAYHRARTWARRTEDRAIVLTADVDVAALRQTLGPGRVMHRNQIIAIDGPVPTSALRWHPEVDLSATPEEVAEWITEILGPHRRRSVDKRHPGVQRLARWVDHQVGSRRRSELRWTEILEAARKWLPEHFVGTQVDLGRVRANPLVGTVHVEVDRRRPLRACAHRPQSRRRALRPQARRRPALRQDALTLGLGCPHPRLAGVDTRRHARYTGPGKTQERRAIRRGPGARLRPEGRDSQRLGARLESTPSGVSRAGAGQPCSAARRGTPNRRTLSRTSESRCWTARSTAVRPRRWLAA